MNLGHPIPEGEVTHRDAIHIAVAPVIVTGDLQRGSYVRFVRGSQTDVRRTDIGRAIGIIDPFLAPDEDGWDVELPEGTKVWMYLLPNTITALRHEWTHPAFEAPKPMAMSINGEFSEEELLLAGAVAMKLTTGPQRELLESFADSIDITYEELIDGATNYVESDDYMSQGSKFEGINTPQGFWEAYDAVTGTKSGKVDGESFFSCSC